MSTSSGSVGGDRVDDRAEEVTSVFPAPIEVEQAQWDADSDTLAEQPAATVLMRIGDYQVVREIGRGGMGVVYEAEQVSLNRRVALKVLPTHVAGDRKALRRFRREAMAAAQLHHTNIVPVFEVGRDGDLAFYAMQFIVGQGLDRIIADAGRQRESAAQTPRGLSSAGLLPGGTHLSAADPSGRRQSFYRSVAEIGRQAAQGLAYAHARGILHRDIKPSNLLVDTAGVVWITDFGLAKAADDDLTVSGDIVGTLRYMAPERFRGEGDARADIYALGLTLYEALALRPAFDSTDRLKLIESIKAQEPPRPRSLDDRVPRDLETIVLKAGDKDPAARYASAHAMAEDLRRFLADEPILARRASALERYFRWARRNPVIAVLGGVLTAVLVIATVCSLLAAQWFHAQADNQRLLAEDRERQREEAVRARAEETAARRKADQTNASLRAVEEDLRRTVYANHSNLALAAWDTNDIGRMHNLLGLTRPRAGGPDLRGWEWRLLWQLAHEERLTFRAEPSDRFVDVAFSPDGQSLACLESQGRIRIFAVRSGQLRQTTGLAGGGEQASLRRGTSALAYSPDGRFLAGPGPDACLALYATDTGRFVRCFESAAGAVLKLAWSPDARTIAAAVSSHVMRIWDAQSGRIVHRNFGEHAGPVAAVAFSPDGLTLASASFDRTVKLWSRDDPKTPRAVLNGHTDEVRGIAFSPDGRQICSAGMDRTIRIWDAQSGAAIAVIWGHASAVTSLAFVPCTTMIATGSLDQTVRLWDTASRQELRTFRATDSVSAVAVSPDSGDVAAASNAMVRVWAASRPPHPRTLRSPSVLTYGGGVECVAFAPDGRRLVSGHDDNALRLWDLRSDAPPRVLKGHQRVVKSVAISPDGQLIASGGQDGTVRLWDAQTGQHRLTFTGHADQIRGLLFLPDGKTVLSSGYDRTIQAWDAATGAVQYVLRGHSDIIHELALSPDGHTLASASYDKTCILWDLAGRQPRLTLRGHADRVNAVAFSPDGRTVATGADDQTIRLWNAADGAPRSVLHGHINEVASLAFNPDGRLASSGSDKTIRLWDPVSGQTVLVLKGHAGRIRCIQFSPDGRTLASASYDRTLKLWEAAPAEALGAEPPAP